MSMHTRLSSKYTLVTGLVLFASMALFAYFNVKTFETISLKDSLREVDRLCDTIISTTHYQMLEDDRERVYQMIEEVGDQEGIVQIRLFNKDGVISYSTEPTEIGDLIDLKAEACNGCHAENVPLSQVPATRRSRTFTLNNGEMVLGVTKEVNNRDSCSTAACHIHANDSSVLGILDVQVSLASLQAAVRTYRMSVLGFTFVLIILLGTCLAFLTHRYVNDPVKELLTYTGRLARGELNVRIHAKHQDELGELAEAFDDMAEHLKQAQKELKDWGNTLESKVEERTAELRAIQSQLVQSAKLASLGELVAGIAHEINNPLTGILMFSSMTASHPLLDPILKPDLELITGETQRCAKIVQGLLDFSRASIPEKKSESIHAIIERTLSFLEQQTIFQNLEIIRQFDPLLPDIPVDREQLSQVFINMMINACQAMPEGGTLSIATGRTEQSASVFIELTDTGTGISPAHLEKIFDPFFSTKDRKGTGLGLSISYGIIRNHGGRIEVRSRLKQGTTFTIVLPMEPGGESGPEIPA